MKKHKSKHTNLRTKDKKRAELVNKLLKQAIREFSKDEYKEAVEKFYKILTIDKNNPDCLYYLGLYYGKIRDFKKATELFEQLLAQEYNYLYVKHIYLCLGYYGTETKEYEKAIQYFQKALDLDFNLVTAMAALGHLYFITGKTEEAIIMLENGLLIEPSNSTLLNTLGYILADKEIDVKKGIECCKKAIKVNPKSGAYYDSLGWAYYKNNQKQLALKMLKQADRMLPDDRIIKFHIKTLESENY